MKECAALTEQSTFQFEIVVQLITDDVILIIFSSWLRTTGILDTSRSEDDVSDAENRIQASL